MKVFIGIGLIFAVCGAGALMFDSSLHGGASWVMGFMMVTGMFLLSAPFIRIWRIHGALSQGHLGAAEVLRVVYSQPGATDTLDSIQNGIARGTWQISQATLFEEQFETDEPWASALQPGSLVQVLIDAKRKCVLLPLGPA